MTTTSDTTGLRTAGPPGFRVRAVRHGPGLADAVAGAVSALQGSDALRPVTVLVPTRSAAVALRRQVATRLGGMAAVRFELPARAAELLAAPELAAAGRRPLRPAVLTEAVRAVLRQAPGRFAPVAGHPATARAIARTVRDLAAVPAGGLAALDRPRGREAVRVAGAVRALLTDRYDDHDLLRAAAGLLAARPRAAAELGAVVAVVDRALSPAATSFLTALAARAPVELLVALTGDDHADAGAHAAAAALGVTAAEPPAAHHGAVRVLSAPDPETEVRAAVRRIAERFDGGVPLHRMALLWTADRPYALLARDALAAAGLPANGGPRARLADTPTGRALLGLLRLAGGGGRPLAREDVAAWLAEAPLRREAGGAAVDGARWDAVSRRAGVVAGQGQWRARLERYATTVERRAADEARDGAGQAVLRASASEAGHARALAGFVDELAQRLGAPAAAGWAAYGDWALGLLDRYVGEPRADWGDEAVEADRRVRTALRGLSELDAVAASVDLRAFRGAVEGELEERLGRQGRLGDGLLIGPLREGLCQELDVVVVVGLVEGLAPPGVREDPVLPDRERAAIPGLPLRREQPAERRRELLTALAAAPERLLCAARSDNRAGRERLPSRWLLAEAGRLAGRPLHSEDLPRLRGEPWLDWLATSAPAPGPHPAGAAELLIASLARWRAGGLPPAQHPLAEGVLARGLEALRERRHGVFGRWTGHVGPLPGLALGDAPLSPTRLQTWAACPFRSFLERVLGVEELLRPEETVRIEPREWGNLLHRVLERFVVEGDPPAAGAPWTAADRERLHRLGDEEADRWEQAGATGKALLWRLDRARLHRTLDAFATGDARLRARDGTAPAQAERAFGYEGDPVALALADGHTLRFRGRVDRVDAGAGGDVVVIDYKTGAAASRHRSALEAHPVGGGQLLQLPVYALAAGEAPGGVRAAYWFLSEDGIEEITWRLDEGGAAAFGDAVATIAGGMEQGLYPQRVGHEWARDRETCASCAYELVCDRDRERRWPAIRELPLLGGLARLEGPAAADRPDAGEGPRHG